MMWDDQPDFSGWPVMMIGMVLFWTVLVVLVVFALRWLRDNSAATTDPRRILDDRLARGEIDAEEYEQVRQLLSARPPVTRSR